MKYMENVQKDIKDFSNMHPNRKLAVFGIILFVFILSILIGVYFSRNQSSTESTDQVERAVTEVTSLSLVPSSETVAVGETVTVSVMIDGEAVQAADIAVDFDPAVFTASAVTNGDVFDSIVREEITDGTVSITSAVSPTAASELNTGEIFSFTLEAVAAGSSELSFDPELTITAKNGLNTLQETQNIVITAQ